MEDHTVMINLIFSWCSAALVLLLALLYPARKMMQKRKPKPGSAPAAAYNILRKTHLAMGILVVPVVFCHCRISAHATGVRSGFGVVLLVLLILLAMTYFLKKPLGRHWKRLHQILAAVLMAITVYHSFIEFL